MFPGIWKETSFTTSSISLGKVPPFVSQRTTHLAPEAFAALIQSNAYFFFDLNPSKKCSASNKTSLKNFVANSILLLIIFKFSFSFIFRACLTWKSQVLPTIHMVFTLNFFFSSLNFFLKELVFLLVMPKETS